MIRIYRQTGENGTMLDRIVSSDPLEAEEHYLRLVQIRQDQPGVVVVQVPPAVAEVVPPARYRLDRRWSGVARELELERQRRQWAEGPVTAWMARAVARLAQLPGAAAAELIGVDSRTWRRWTANADSPSRRAMPFAAYHALLVATGLHPDYGRLSDRERRQRLAAIGWQGDA